MICIFGDHVLDAYMHHQVQCVNSLAHGITMNIYEFEFFPVFFYFKLLDPLYDLDLWPMMTWTYDPTHDLNLEFFIFFLKQDIS